MHRDTPTPSVLYQSFHWHSAGDGDFYRRLSGAAKKLRALGIGAVWLPPQTKATGIGDVGYGIYDLYDLGEFKQKGDRRTKYGSKEDYLRCIKTLQEAGLAVYGDVVLNHKAGADETERVQAVEVNPENREESLGEAHEIEAWTKFTFPGRARKYSDFEWNWTHFTGVDYDQASGTKGIFRLIGEDKDWARGVSGEKGNFDYLMFADIDHAHPEVAAELKRWAEWYVETSGLDGFRMDAVKHIDQAFMKDFAEHIQAEAGEDFYVFGEYWLGDDARIVDYLKETKNRMDLFDVPLHFNMKACADAPENFDLRTIFDGSLVQSNPLQAVTFVDNHDTEPGQSLESWIAEGFKPMAYALILLRRDGYPCVFSADYDIADNSSELPSHQQSIEKLLKLRKRAAQGEQTDYFVDPGLIGWLRSGGEGEDRLPVAVVYAASQSRREGISEEESAFARAQAEAGGEQSPQWIEDGRFIVMQLGEDMAGRVFRDAFANLDDLRITVAEDGRAAFPTGVRNPAIWVPEELAEDVFG